MKIILSPSKSQNFDHPSAIKVSSPILFPTKTKQLVARLKNYNKKDLQQLMNISPKLAELNYDRYQNWNKAPEKAALSAFNGDVYQAFIDHPVSNKELKYLEKHLRIISGLYGILTPQTLIKPYRLEMGRKMQIKSGKSETDNLYDFWRETVTKHFAKEDVIVNLASNEYSSVLDPAICKDKLLDISFKTMKNGVPRAIALFAKRERGAMAYWMAKNNITKVDDLKKYKQNGYRFNKTVSTANKFVFINNH